MGLFDFLKKSEFAKIKSLENEISLLQSQLNSKETYLIQLQIRVESLEKYSVVVDAELEANYIIEQANQQARVIISKGIQESDNLKHEASVILDEAKKRLENAQIEALATKAKTDNEISNLLLEANYIIEQANQQARVIISKGIQESDNLKHEASVILDEAKKRLENAQIEALATKAKTDNEISNLLLEARKKELELRNNANNLLDKAKNEASEIVSNAEARALEIAGDAYKAKNEAEALAQTVTALKNTVNGYGDEYIVPSYSLLDQLAEDFSYTDAGKRLEKAREDSRSMVKHGTAAKCDYVEDNRRTTAVNFITDAFNGKVDTVLANVKQDNFGTLRQKIIDAYRLVNHLGKAFRNAVVTPGYLDSRVEELRWAVVVTELKNKEREEQRRIKEQIREEERAKREFEKAVKDAEKEEETIKKALEKATKELAAASDEQKQKYEAKLAELNERLKIAEEKGQRALSMAQQTKSGHVYIISNIGSFGENVYKIGMTRRLEPEDRIKELGDASVPFSFDIHALIYSNNAPSLETELHKYFVDNQLNKVNPRKEFFKVGLKDIRNKIESLDLQAKWTMVSQAAEYRESLAIEQEMSSNESKHKEWENLQLRRLSNENYTDEEAI